MVSKRWFWLAVALQVFVLLAMVGRQQYTLQTGAPVTLETAPVDPWEVFRGQYVQLSYKISQLQEGDLPMTGAPYRRGQQVWVTLQTGNPYWTAVSVSTARPAVQAGQVAIRGKVEWSTQASDDDGNGGEPSRDETPAIPGQQRARIFVRYGIEQFYVPEGQGPEIEQNRLSLTVEARVDRFGRPAVSRVFLDGKELRWR